jgi:hypothetical protein
MIHPVQQQRVYARVGGKDFKDIARRGVAVKNAGNIFTNTDNDSPTTGMRLPS